MKWCLLGLLVAAPAWGAGRTDITIIGEGARKTSIDLSGLGATSEGSPAVFRSTLERDLVRSGWFAVAAPGRAAVSVSGTAANGHGRLAVHCRVLAATGRVFMDEDFSSEADDARKLAHDVADRIVWSVKRVKGIASTRIALIGSRDGKKDIYACDADGGNLTRISHDGAVCLSPAWSPDGRFIAYTSFCRRYPDVYLVDLTANTRERFVGFSGLNTGADISPDGGRMALTLSKDGNPDVYVMDMGSRRLTRVTRTAHATEASPSWSPDGRSLAFVSDRSGSPQVYVQSAAGGDSRRITLWGSENVAPDWGPDGRIAFTSRRDGRYHVCVIDADGRNDTKLTSEYADHEDPCWARDARHIVYAKTVGRKSDLYILDTLGDPPLRLTTLQGDWYSPDWSR